MNKSNTPIILDRFYSTSESSTIKCGECWFSDIMKTRRGEYTGDEAVLESHLTILPEHEPVQCDDCLEQNDAYDDLGEDGF